MLQFVSSAIMTAYRARRQEQDHIDNQVDSQVDRPFIPTSLSFNERPVTHQNEVEFCDPFTSIECPAVPTVSENRPVQKVLRYKNGTFSPSASITANDASVTVQTVQASAPLYPAIPRTPTFQRIFRD